MGRAHLASIAQEGRDAVRAPQAHSQARQITTAGAERCARRVHPRSNRPEPPKARETDPNADPDSSLSERGKPRLLNKPAIDQIDPKRTLAFLGHLVLYEPNDRCDDRPSDAAANCLTEESTNIHATGCIAQNRQKREDLTSDAASDCARDRVARRAEAQVLRRRAHCIATECTGYNLNYDVDEYPRHMSLPCPQNGRLRTSHVRTSLPLFVALPHPRASCARF